LAGGASMTTVCKACKAPVVQRVYLQLPGTPLLFAETYQCGAVVCAGLVEGCPVVRSCPAPVSR
jgi:hypothetical protein